MNQKPRAPRDSHAEGLDSEASQTNAVRPSYLEPWILNVLLEYKEDEAKEEGQLGHILKVLNESRGPHHDGQNPAAVLHIGDGRCYIQVVVTAKAIQMSKCSLPQSGFSSILGHFITLQNYRVCFKETAKVEECRFYLVLDCFCVMPVKRQRMSQQDCNREPLILKKIKELWQRGFALQPSSEPSSVSEILREIKQDRLATLKRNVEACLSVLDAEELAAYPDTKWQVECQRDKIHQDTFTVPGKFLVISEDNEAVLRKSCSSKPSLVVLDTDENGQDDEISTISFFSADSENVVDSLENPWDVFPGMTLTSSSEMSDTPSSLPHVQQMQLAMTAEEEAAVHANSCTPDFLETRDQMPRCSSSQAEPVERKTPSPSLLPSHSSECLKELARQESRLAAHHTNKTSDTDESFPCGQLLRNSHSQASACLLSSVHSTVRSDLSLGPLPENVAEDNLARLQGHKMVRGTSKKLMENSKKLKVAKRKQMIQDEEEPTETSSSSTIVSPKALHQLSPAVFPKYNKQGGKLVPWKRPLKFVSTPKKSRMQEEPQVQQPQSSAQLRHSERLVERERKRIATEVTTGRPSDCCCDQCGAPQQECVTSTFFDFTNKPPTPELCTQVRSTRISRALLGWACWVFSNMQKQ
ncbi:uncharacterized protein [Tiliqua scincoides]|uniref:uncharacterized protein n=1 Tax=Tiliqua scincoides TaxID=71010 RepID=UPI003463522B